MERSDDLVIIGGGAAAWSAALAARAAGLATVLVRRAPGASALAGGGWRGPLPDIVADALVAQRIAHDALQHPLPHPDGELRAFDYAPASHLAALVETGSCIVAVDGLPCFRARALARLWGTAASAEVIADTITLPHTPPAGWATIALAHAIEANPAVLAAALRDVVARTGCTRIIMPPVLGVDDPSRVRVVLEAAAGVPVGEALGVPPSLPGWRLDRALERAVRAAGVRVVEGDVVDALRATDRIDALTVLPRGGSETMQLAAPRFLLATGRYVGGGIAANRVFAETVFGAAVWIEHLGERFDDVVPLALSDP
ncbi:MAG: FAD-binding protein, partial [Longimicrobiales bacterium]